MNCIKCGSKNLDENLKCLDCGNDNHKGKHIDIEDVKPQTKNGHNFEKTRKIVLTTFIFGLIILLSFGVTLLIYFIKDKSNSRVINEYNNLSKNSNVFVLYIGNNSEYDNLLNLYKKYYEYDYMKINSGRLTRKNTKMFENKFNLSKLKESIIIYKKGEFISANNFNSKKGLVNYLKKGKVIPNVIENPKKEKKLYNDTLASKEATLIYISFVNNNLVEKNINTFKDLCENYKIKFQFIRGYILAEQQILNYLSQYGYSSMKNGLIIALEDGNIKKVVDMDNLYFDDYIDIFQNYDIINSMDDNLNYIDLDTFNSLINDNKKHIIVFGNQKCKYCDSLKYLLGSIVRENKIEVYYIEVADDFNIVDNLKDISYQGTNTYPLTIVLENKKILDYVIGLSEKDYYINLFTKDGIIR